MALFCAEGVLNSAYKSSETIVRLVQRFNFEILPQSYLAIFTFL